jgi:hypothetical protein
MKDNLHLILITRNQSSQLFRSKAHNFVVVCDSYQQASERIQEYLSAEYIPFDKQSLYNDWLEDQIWFTDNINEDFHEKHNIEGELFKKYYSDYYFDKPKGYKTETGSLVDVSYDENGLVTGYSYDTKLCYYDNIELDSKVYDFLMDKYKTYEIENLFNDYINLGNISGLHKTDIIAYLNTESVEYYMQDVYSDIIDEDTDNLPHHNQD